MDKVITAFVVAIGVGLVVFGALFVIGVIAAPFVMLAWNATMPFIFGLPAIGYWHGFWLFFLSGLLIKSTQTNNNGNK